MITLLSCNTDENTDNINQLDNNWFMQDYSCGLCNMITPDLTEEYILWNFNTQNNTVSVVNYFSENFIF